jgi:hypothetical protein
MRTVRVDLAAAPSSTARSGVSGKGIGRFLDRVFRRRYGRQTVKGNCCGRQVSFGRNRRHDLERERLIELLNENLAREYQAIIAYVPALRGRVPPDGRCRRKGVNARWPASSTFTSGPTGCISTSAWRAAGSASWS